MPSIAIVILGIIGMLLGWFVYSKFIASRIFKLDDSFVTPAHTMKDGVDYVPTNKVVLWGHHFTSVAGAAPIVGPAIAVYWGWVPAVLWVVFGTILFAGVHDMGALWASARHKGKSMGALSETVIGKRDFHFLKRNSKKEQKTIPKMDPKSIQNETQVGPRAA